MRAVPSYFWLLSIRRRRRNHAQTVLGGLADSARPPSDRLATRLAQWHTAGLLHQMGFRLRLRGTEAYARRLELAEPVGDRILSEMHPSMVARDGLLSSCVDSVAGATS